MAEKALKKVEDQLDCSICLESYTDPKLLQCLHVFCQKCLVKLVVKDQQGQLILTCPICRQDTPVPPSGTAGLQPAFHVNHLLEIAEELKKATGSPSGGPAKIEVSAQEDKIKLFYCREHAGKEVELYCVTCEEPICLKCAIKGGSHHSHDCVELQEAFEKYKAEMTASLEPMEQHLVNIEKTLLQLDGHRGEMSNQRAVIEADIHKSFRRLHEALDARETEIVGQLHQLVQRNLKSLATQRDQIETLQARLGSCVGYMKESPETGRRAEALMMKAAVVKQVRELTATFSHNVLEPKDTKAGLVFTASEDIFTAIKQYGEVSKSVTLDPSKCHATGKGTKAAVVGETATVLLQALNSENQPYKKAILSLECKLLHELKKTMMQGSVKKRGESHGQYAISYRPTIKGKHQLCIKVEGQHIKGSPFNVAVKFPGEKLQDPVVPIITVTDVKGPLGVAVNKRQELVVSEWARDCISVFSPSGEKLQSFGSSGSDRGQFRGPYGVAVDGDGNILVVDNRNNRIQKFTSQGQLLAAVGSEGSGPLQFCRPRGIAFNAKNDKIYVTDNHRVQVLNSDLSFSSSFGQEGKGRGQFQYPRDVAFDRAGNIYVTDFDNDRVQVFTAEGKFLRMFGVRGDAKGQLSRPSNIAIDANDKVYISEFKNHRISVFTSEGVFVTSFGSHGKQPGQFSVLYGLYVDGCGVVYVCDWDNNRVQIM